MHASRLFLALTPILGALAADQVVALNLPTDAGDSLTAVELLGSVSHLTLESLSPTAIDDSESTTTN
jgi:hypothetical protein